MDFDKKLLKFNRNLLKFKMDFDKKLLKFNRNLLKFKMNNLGYKVEDRYDEREQEDE